MKNIQAFFRGMIEFRASFTTYYRDWRNARAYDLGREFAHIATWRRFDGLR